MSTTTPSLRGAETQGSRKATGWLALAITVIVLTIIFAWIIVAMIRDSVQDEVIQRCNPGLCKFSTISGIKTCPAVGDPIGIRVNLGAEFCTSRDYCQKPGFTCAVQADQTLLCAGECGPGNPQCRCVADPTVP